MTPRMLLHRGRRWRHSSKQVHTQVRGIRPWRMASTCCRQRGMRQESSARREARSQRTAGHHRKPHQARKDRQALEGASLVNGKGATWTKLTLTTGNLCLGGWLITHRGHHTIRTKNCSFVVFDPPARLCHLFACFLGFGRHCAQNSPRRKLRIRRRIHASAFRRGSAQRLKHRTLSFGQLRLS